jgi:AmmeMemoRadiSam system protein B/AmmeMemoRadiSam system protein A
VNHQHNSSQDSFEKQFRLLLALAFTCLLLSGCTHPTDAPSPTASSTPATVPTSPPPTSLPSGPIRSSVLAGSWYPEDPDELRAMVDTFLEAVESVDGTPIALVVPHAGYVYSGSVAAYGFKQLEGADIDVAIIIASDHQQPLSDPISIWVGQGFETPLGIVPVDVDLAEAIIASNPLITADSSAHEGEHPIEIELPLLQRVCPTCSIVPVLMGDASESTVEALVDALRVQLADRHAVIIASSDLSHYPSYEDARLIDGATLAAIETGLPAQLSETLNRLMSSGFSNLLTCACGEGPILVVMQVAQTLGADTITILQYANSGDTPFGDTNQVVGYGAVMFWRYDPPELQREQKEELLELARTSIEFYLENGNLPDFETDDPEFIRRSGVFVTLEKEGELRGCIGYFRADRPLYRRVQEVAVDAAISDNRFPPLTVEELSEVHIEISILSPLQRVNDIQEIQVGVHGLLIYQAGQQGVLLPQVAVDNNWDRDEFLENLCLKAGLPEDCWNQSPALYSYSAMVFGEEK